MINRIYLCLLLSVVVASMYATPLPAQEITIKIEKEDQPSTEPFQGVRPAADMAILLDTSNSMDGLINQAKSQLWTIVQKFASAKKAGKTPLLRVAVFEYGNTGLPAAEGYIRQVVGLTDDLDKVSEALFSLTTNGGDEYCGMVISEAIKRLDWSREPNAFKAIFIAGNEPFTQGPVDYQQSCRTAIEAGVVVNTIHCGNYQAGVSGKWKHGAEMAEGEYLNINQDKAVIAIKTPHDKILIELNEKLNRTYLWYGKDELRMHYRSNQQAQDTNALQQLGPAGLSSRAGVKAGSLYSNNGRDLVDTFANNRQILTEVSETELPEEIRSLPAAKRAEFVQQKAAERKAIQKQIAEMNRKRLAFVENERKKMAKGEDATLGDAMQAAITEQMRKSGFQFDR